ncbi:hypothetical protein Tco_0761799 [Tanacetum coccineum]
MDFSHSPHTIEKFKAYILKQCDEDDMARQEAIVGVIKMFEQERAAKEDLRKQYGESLKRILCYVRGTLDYGLQLFSSSTSDLVAYSNADWAGFPTPRCFLVPVQRHSIVVLPMLLLRLVGYAICCFADIFTKELSSALFEEFHSSLSVRCLSVPTAGEC